MNEELISLVAAAIIVALISGFVLLWEIWSCQASGSMMNKPATYGLLTGCMIKHNNEWVPLKNYRVL